MKCAYHPIEESEQRCAVCNIPLCKTCTAEAELENSGACHACTRQGKIGKIYHYFRLVSCGLGITWVVVAMLIFTNEPQLITRVSYGLYGLLGAFIINTLASQLLIRMMISDLKPYQRVFVGLSRYAVTGNKLFFNQALKAMNKVEDMSQYQDALFDQLVTVLILQPYDLPSDWVSYLAENFKLTEQELLDGILEYGTDVFYENIFNHYHYQAMEPFIEILKRQERDDLYNKLIDDILLELKDVDLKEMSKPPEYVPGQPGQSPTMKKQDPKIVRNQALLTQLAMTESELGEFLKRVGREKDYNKILDFTDNYELPAVPTGTIDSFRKLAQGQQTQQYAQQNQQPLATSPRSDLIAPPQPNVELPDNTAQLRTCAECGKSFPKHDLSSYNYEKVQVKVCSSCNKTLEADGHRQPKLLADMKK